jgi:hypothetical protein
VKKIVVAPKISWNKTQGATTIVFTNNKKPSIFTLRVFWSDYDHFHK